MGSVVAAEASAGADLDRSERAAADAGRTPRFVMVSTAAVTPSSTAAPAPARRATPPWRRNLLARAAAAGILVPPAWPVPRPRRTPGAVRAPGRGDVAQKGQVTLRPAAVAVEQDGGGTPPAGGERDRL